MRKKRAKRFLCSMGMAMMIFFGVSFVMSALAGDVLADVADDHGNTCTEATALEVPVTYSDSGLFTITAEGDLERPDDIDYFSILLPDPGTLEIFTSGSTLTYGYLKDAGCNTIRETKDIESVPGNFFISKDLDTAGTYYIGVKPYIASKTGSYTLNVEFEIAGEEDDDGVDEEPETCAATYLLGSKDPRLDTLRRFRDEALAVSPAGRKLIDAYYKNSESINAFLVDNPNTNAIAKQILNAAVSAVEMVLKLLKE